MKLIKEKILHGCGYSSTQWSFQGGATPAELAMENIEIPPDLRRTLFACTSWSQKYRAAGINKINGLIKNKTKLTDYFAGFLFLQPINFYYAYGVALLESKVPKNVGGFRFPPTPP